MKKKVFAVIIAILAVSLLTVPCFANVSGVIEETWKSANTQIKDVVDKVVFPALSMVLVVAFFVKVGAAYFDYRKHGQFEWGATRS